MKALDWVSDTWFQWVHDHHLVYNTCWEDPRLDRVALDLGPDDTVLVITSAGCNALDYALEEPRHVHAVDMNPRQNALLELKLAGIRELDFDCFFAIFGRGRLDAFDSVYRTRLRRALPPHARTYWDEHGYFFSGRGPRDSFYFRGTTGYFAWLMNLYVNRRPRLRDGVNALLNAQSLDEQREVYFDRLHELFWNRFIRWAVGREMTLSLLGVPRAQRQQVERHYGGGIAQFIEDCLEAVFAHLPMHDNYFWRVYLTGKYTRECCPEYLKKENFHHLRNGLVDRVTTHTDTVEGFLTKTHAQVSRFVLLDHMDWLWSHRGEALVREWQAIVDRAAPNARLLWRSGGVKVDFVDPIEVGLNGVRQRVGELLTYHPELAADLHRRDRVHTYGSFHIADLATA